MASIGSEHASRSRLFVALVPRLTSPARSACVARSVRRRQRFFAGASACRRRLSHPRRQRAGRLRVADRAGALARRLPVRHLCLRMDLGAAARRHGRSRSRLGLAALHPRIHRTQELRAVARLSSRQPLACRDHCDVDRRRRSGTRQACLAAHRRHTVVPLYLACAALPICGLAQVQSGIARSYDWVNLGLSPAYVLRQIAAAGAARPAPLCSACR